MLAIAFVCWLALVALCLIHVALACIGWRSYVLFEGMLEFVEVEGLFGSKARVHYFFSTYFSKELRSDGRLLEVRARCVLPLNIRNDSGDYVPREGHNIRITVRENIFKEAISFKTERLPDLNPANLYQFSQFIDADLD